jgi:hypothetical protein
VNVNVFPPPPPPVAEHKPSPASIIGVQAMAGGGATGFVDDGARAFTDTGGAWQARVSAGTRLPVALEGTYVGSAQGMKALGLNTNAVLLGNGAEGTVRINFTSARIQPYIFGGAGWINYQVTNTSITTTDLNKSDNIFEVPFGVGLAGRLGAGFVLDIRGTGRAAFNDTLFDRVAATANAGSSSMSSWNATAQVGYEF